MKNKKQTKNKQYHKDAKKATHNGSRSIQRIISWKKKLKKENARVWHWSLAQKEKKKSKNMEENTGKLISMDVWW